MRNLAGKTRLFRHSILLRASTREHATQRNNAQHEFRKIISARPSFGRTLFLFLDLICEHPNEHAQTAATGALAL